ncbi:MAG TPA: hypothetical protein VD947_04225 [Patescibacteria group bacterium]|nr:hypothetical protein [Patescibacteria group bacterium]
MSDQSEDIGTTRQAPKPISSHHPSQGSHFGRAKFQAVKERPS